MAQEEPKKYPIKTDLFRFVTFRAPDQMTQVAVSYRFISHPNPTSSYIGSFSEQNDNEADLKKHLEAFEAASSYKQIRDINPRLYDATSLFFKNRNGLPEKAPEDIKDLLLTDEQLSWMWDQLLYQITTRSSPYVRQAAIQMIIGDNIFKHAGEWGTDNFKLLLHAKIVIPKELIELIKLHLYVRCAGDMKGVTNLGIADFRRVEQEVCSYVPGEVSHIENIMAREYKEKSTRNLVRSEQTIEVTNETEIENLTDVTTSTRNELSTEIASVIDEAKTSNYGGSVSVSAEYLGAKIDVDAYTDFANSNSSSFSNSTAKTYAEEVTKRALERIVQRTTEKRTSTIIKEFEENNKHGFDNRLGDKHVTGIYRWVDIIYKNRLVNYGKRLMLEFMVPEPAEFYKRVLKYKPEGSGSDSDINTPEAPLTLADFKITKPGDITEEIANNAGAYYGVSIETLPLQEEKLTKSIVPLGPVKHERSTQSMPLLDLTVPPKYEAYKMIGSYTYEYRANSASSSALAFCNLTVGGTIVSSGGNYAPSKTKKTVNVDHPIGNLPGNIPVSVSYSGVFGFFGAITVYCKLRQSVIDEWKSDIYNRLQNAYNQMLAQYESEVIAQEQAIPEEIGEQEVSNPAFNRQIEQRELKRACIEMITKPFCRKQGERSYIDLNACDKYLIPQVNQTANFEQYASQVKFFEQVFEWNLISYIFYPYYWADKCDWADLMKTENADTVFQAFLQAGMARVVVPVRPQFNEAVTYYMETGDIWLGGDLVPGTEDDLYMDISDEMIGSTTQNIPSEAEWLTRVPTSMAIIQDKSACLAEDALPVCTVVENTVTTTNIKKSSNLLGNIVPVDPIEPEESEE